MKRRRLAGKVLFFIVLSGAVAVLAVTAGRYFERTAGMDAHFAGRLADIDTRFGAAVGHAAAVGDDELLGTLFAAIASDPCVAGLVLHEGEAVLRRTAAPPRQRGHDARAGRHRPRGDRARIRPGSGA